MPPLPSRLWWSLSLAASFITSAYSKQKTWDSFWEMTESNQSIVVDIEESLEEDPTSPVFVASNFTGALGLPSLPIHSDAAVQSGIVVKAPTNWDSSPSLFWDARIVSTGGVTFTGMTISPDNGDVLVCGNASGAMSFIPSTILGSAISSAPVGFVARLDPASGFWSDYFLTEGVLPTDISTRLDGSILITANECLAKSYTPEGVEMWSVEKPAETLLQVSIGTSNYAAYILSRDPSQDDQVVLHKLSGSSGAVKWSISTGETGADFPTGLAIDENGKPVIAFYNQPTANMNLTEGFLARVKKTGEVSWQVPIGTPDRLGSMTTSRLAVSTNGMAWVGTTIDGDWKFPDLDPRSFEDDVAIVAIDPKGEFYNYQRSEGKGVELVKAVCITRDGSVTLGGSRSGGERTTLGKLDWTPGHATETLLVTTMRDLANQRRYIIRNIPGSTAPLDKDALRYISRLNDSTIELDIENGTNGTAVICYATPNQAADIADTYNLIVEEEIELASNSGEATPGEDSGWSLQQLTNAANPSLSTFKSPQTTNPVRLYLIDTAVSHMDTWFAANSDLSYDGTELVRSSSSPEFSSQFEHGTRMLSLIAGPQTGAANATPIQLLNYDVYPDGPSTTSGLVASGIMKAVKHFQADESGTPAVICLASGSSAMGDSAIIRYALEAAVDSGISVVISAGNNNDDASNYVPARYGVNAGVICVGGSDAANEKTILSNYGTPVDLLAPGENVRTLHFAEPQLDSYELMTGTSPAAAFAAAAAIVEASIDPSLTPSELEDQLKSQAHPSPELILQLSYPGEMEKGILPGDSTSIDGDFDGIPDVIELFHGTSIDDAGSRPDPISLIKSGDSVTATFQISGELFSPESPFTLENGCCWQAWVSDDLINWTEAEGTLSTTALENGDLEAQLTYQQTSSRGFFQIEVIEPDQSAK